MVIRPVFRSRFEVNIWKKLDSDFSILAKKPNYYQEIADSVIKNGEPVDSAILVKLMEILRKTQSGDLQLYLEQLAEKHRPDDCNPLLTAASIYLESGNLEKAKEMMSRLRQRRSIPFTCCVKAKIAMREGNLDIARKELMRARCSDPSYALFYDLIQQMEPTGGWMYRRNIELIVNGEDPIPCGSTGPETPAEVLYKIYFNWYRGRRNEATESMISSEEYANKDPEYVLASARMSMDERDWHSAQMMYDILLTKSYNCVYVICEAANANYSGNNYERALALYREAEALDPGSPMVMKGLVHAYASLGMKGEAYQCLQEFLDTENAHLTSYLKGARLLTEMTMYSEAAQIIGRAQMSYPDDPEVNILCSDIELLRGNVNAALDVASMAAKSNPKDLGCKLQRAKVLFRGGRSDKAIKELEKIIKSDPESTEAYLLMKDIYLAQGDVKEAETICRKILEIDIGNVEALDVLNSVRSPEKSGDMTDTGYRDRLLDDRRPENFISILSDLIKGGRYREAADLCYEQERTFGGIAMVRRLRGNAEFALEEYDKAIDSYSSALELEPNDPVLWHSRGMAEEEYGRPDAAEADYDRAILLDPTESEFWVSKASIREKKNDLKSAVDSLNKAIELRPDSSYALVRKALIFSKMDKFDEALFFMDLAMVADPGKYSVLRVEKNICIEAGRDEQAMAACVKMTEINPKDPDPVKDLVRLYLGAGRKEDAVYVSEKAIAENPESVQMLAIRKDLYCYVGDSLEVIGTCRRILDLDPDNKQAKTDLAEALEASGDVISANRIYSELQYDDGGSGDFKGMQNMKGSKPPIPDRVKRLSERMLRRAYTKKCPLNDPDLITSLDIDETTVSAILAYLSDISLYGDIVQDTEDFERMEVLSMNAVIKGNCNDLDNDPLISIPCAYVAGGTRDADEAKQLVAYVYKVMTMKVDDCPGELVKASKGLPENASTPEIVKELHVGLYRARQIRSRI